MKKIAVYNGSFDPVTNGHLDIIERAAKIFDILYVTVAIHPTKVGLFTIEQRKELLKKATAHLKNVIVDSTDELFMDYVKKVIHPVLIHFLSFNAVGTSCPCQWTPLPSIILFRHMQKGEVALPLPAFCSICRRTILNFCDKFSLRIACHPFCHHLQKVFF